MSAPRRAMKRPPYQPRRWGGFVHLLARFYMNYMAACKKAARRKKNRAVDIDTRPSKDGTAWALHWGTLGQNKLHDPLKHYGRKTKINSLTNTQLARMRGPKGQRPYKLTTLLRWCSDHGVRAEVELKATVSQKEIARILRYKQISAMDKKGLLQFKTMATLGAPNGPIWRLRAAHDAGGTTILSFNKFRKKGISKRLAYPVTDYVRGRAKWIA